MYCRFAEGLLPGLQYELLLPLEKRRFPNPPFAIPRDLTVEPGRDRDVGEIRSNTTPDRLKKEARDE
jgi:hypothetical protein